MSQRLEWVSATEAMPFLEDVGTDEGTKRALVIIALGNSDGIAIGGTDAEIRDALLRFLDHVNAHGSGPGWTEPPASTCTACAIAEVVEATGRVIRTPEDLEDSAEDTP